MKIRGNQIDTVPTEGGDMKTAHIKHVKPILPADRVVNAIPDYTQFSRMTKHLLDPNKIPNLGWTLTTKVSSLPGIDTKMLWPVKNRKNKELSHLKLARQLIKFKSRIFSFCYPVGYRQIVEGRRLNLLARSACGVSCVLKRCALVFEFPVAQAWQIDTAMISVVPEYQGYQKDWCQE